MRQLADRLERLDGAIVAATAELRRTVRATKTPLLGLCGVGEVLAARLLGELGQTPRLRSAAALAALAGVAPLAVASGGRRGHRVDPGGNRRLNRALHVIALCQRRCDERARAYYAKQRAEGKTGRAAMRRPKRRLVDVVYRLLARGDDATAALRAAG